MAIAVARAVPATAAVVAVVVATAPVVVENSAAATP